jgi:hypothetical protein
MRVNRQLVNLYIYIYFEKMIHKNFVVLNENCHWLKLMYLFLRHVVQGYSK